MTDEDVFAFMRAVQAVKVDEAEKEAQEAQRALDAQVDGGIVRKARRKNGGRG